MLTLALLTATGTDTSFEIKKLLRAAGAAGVQSQQISEREIVAMSKLISNGRTVVLPAAIVVRTGAETKPETVAALRTLEAAGATILNSADAVALGCSKFEQAAAFEAAGVPTPETTLLDGSLSPQSVGRVLGWPLLVKPDQDTNGNNIAVIRSDIALGRVMERSIAERRPMLAQRLVDGAAQDFRIPVIDGIPAQPMCRTARNGIITNAARGAKCKLVTDPSLASQFADLAVRAAKATGMSFAAGVDVIVDRTGAPYVLESNVSLGFQAYQRTQLFPRRMRLSPQFCIAESIITAALSRVRVSSTARPSKPAIVA